MKKHLIIVRGVPGCGKSTFAEYISLIGDLDSIKRSTICCADDFVMKDGQYKFNQKAIGIAHKVCHSKCEKAMAAGETRVIVANTSTTEKEINPYIALAEKYGYMVFSVIVENRHGGVNVHNVPEETLEKMVARFSIKLK